MFKNNLLEIYKPLMTFVRGKKHGVIPKFKNKGHSPPGAVIYPGNIKYYPRPGEVEPDVTPSKLLRVERIKSLVGVPWFHKKIMRELHMGTKKKHYQENFVTIVKNIPEVNKTLWEVKHLVRITPITFPYGEPTMEDVKHTKLDDSGVCLVTKKIAPAPEAVEEKKKQMEDKTRLNNTYIETDCRLKWLNPIGGGFK